MTGVVISVFPFYWIVVMATNTTAGHLPLSRRSVVRRHTCSTNIRHLFDKMDFFGSMRNTMIVAVCTTLLVLFFDSLAAFAFAKYDFPGEEVPVRRVAVDVHAADPAGDHPAVR